MKNSDFVNWLAVLGIGGSFAFHGELAAQEPPPTRRPSIQLGERGQRLVVINHEEQYTGGFDRLYLDLFRIDALPPSWRPALSTWRGPPRRAGRPDLYSF